MSAVESISDPPIRGLILIGGASTRMGKDKSTIDYHGKPQREYMLDLLTPFTGKSFISCRPGQLKETDLPVIEDTYADLGPFGGILSAFQVDPHCAWLVVACDFPLLDQKAIAQLVHERDPESIATSFLDEKSHLPEPWISILEPKIYPILLNYVQQGRSSLRGVLEDYHSHVIRPQDPDVLLNANTPEEAALLKQMLSQM